MLPSQNRIKKESDFFLIIKKAKAFNSDLLVLKKAKNNLKDSRFGFVVSQKISKKAVVRNKIKRRMREIIRKCLKQIAPGFDFVFFARKSITEKTFQEIEEGIKNILLKAGAIKKAQNGEND